MPDQAAVTVDEPVRADALSMLEQMDAYHTKEVDTVFQRVFDSEDDR